MTRPSRRRTLRLAWRLLWTLFLVALLVVGSRTTVDFVYRAF